MVRPVRGPEMRATWSPLASPRPPHRHVGERHQPTLPLAPLLHNATFVDLSNASGLSHHNASDNAGI
ncbi:hypothetical protein E2C01_059284 [Portunus trituberculatus]|uniref:Uncharacterized protein n=1 Tax=Portunus trituberculatus TaxID=210409 RepID=A0A5B7H6D5_PORTR|nr:hypothetical protein [Portunus trituberculatus]